MPPEEPSSELLTLAMQISPSAGNTKPQSLIMKDIQKAAALIRPRDPIAAATIESLAIENLANNRGEIAKRIITTLNS